MKHQNFPILVNAWVLGPCFRGKNFNWFYPDVINSTDGQVSYIYGEINQDRYFAHCEIHILH